MHQTPANLCSCYIGTRIDPLSLCETQSSWEMRSLCTSEEISTPSQISLLGRCRGSRRGGLGIASLDVCSVPTFGELNLCTHKQVWSLLLLSSWARYLLNPFSRTLWPSRSRNSSKAGPAVSLLYISSSVLWPALQYRIPILCWKLSWNGAERELLGKKYQTRTPETNQHCKSTIFQYKIKIKLKSKMKTESIKRANFQ